MIALAGLVPLLPAQFAISPASEGFANRLLLPSAPGIALATVALCCLFAYGLAGLASRTRLAPPAALAALAALSVSLVRDEIRSQDRWAAIRPEQDRVIDAVREVAPTPGPFITAFVTLGHPTELPGGLASFSGAYDLDGALKLAYDSQYVGGRPLPPGSECGPDGLVFSPDILLADSAAVVLPYLLRFYLVNVNTGRGERIKDPARCRSFLATSGSEG